MDLAAARPATSRRRARACRLTIIALLVAAISLLAAPGVAGAHVKARYRTEYKKAVSAKKDLFLVYATQFQNASIHCGQLRATMEPLINDPDQRETLLNGEAYALTIHDNLERTIPLWQKGTDSAFTTFFLKGKRWFATARQRSTFRHRAARLESVFSMVLEVAYPKVSLAFLDLSQDPPDLASEATHIFDAGIAKDEARGLIDDRIKGLMKLL
jgi:hypothetical protein